MKLNYSKIVLVAALSSLANVALAHGDHSVISLPHSMQHAAAYGVVLMAVVVSLLNGIRGLRKQTKSNKN